MVADDRHQAAVKRFSAKPDAHEAIAGWLDFLKVERRASPKTTEAYGRDLAQFCRFLTDHLGGEPDLMDLAVLAAADFRSFLAARRNAGAESRTLSRQLSAVRSFYRHLEKNGVLKNLSLAGLKGPKLAHAVPRPLSVPAATRLCDEAARPDDTPQWVIARDRAVLLLLYGCGLRISEALNLSRRDAPLEDDTLNVLGKGGKTRLVPVLPLAREAVRQYLDLCPKPLASRRSAVRRRQGRQAQAAHHPAVDRSPARRLGPSPKRHPSRAAPQLRHPSLEFRGRSQIDSGAFGPCQPLDHPNLYGG